MKIKSLLVAAFAVLALASCSKSESSNEPKGEGNVVITVRHETGTRAEAEDIGAAAISLGAGHVFFTDGGGIITRHVEIKNAGAVGPDQVNKADFGAGAVITLVPNNSTKCYILSNAVTTIAASEVSNNIATILAKTVAVSDMDDPTGGVVNVPLWGEGNVVPAAGNTLATTVTMKAIGSRLQVRKFTGITDIVSYEVEGIFINNYFNTMPISKAVTAAGITDNASVAASYVGGTAAYPATLPLYDYNAAGIGQMSTPLICVPLNGGGYANPVWAYNVFPNEALNTAATLPQIVVRLKDVVWFDGVANQTLPNPQFITVKGIKKTGVALTQIEGGHVYSFDDIQFERKNITNVPVVTSVNATVNVNMIPWVPETVEPEL